MSSGGCPLCCSRVGGGTGREKPRAAPLFFSLHGCWLHLARQANEISMCWSPGDQLPWGHARPAFPTPGMYARAELWRAAVRGSCSSPRPTSGRRCFTNKNKAQCRTLADRYESCYLTRPKIMLPHQAQDKKNRKEEENTQFPDCCSTLVMGVSCRPQTPPQAVTGIPASGEMRYEGSAPFQACLRSSQGVKAPEVEAHR